MLLQYSLIVLLSSITSCFGQSGTPTETGVGELGILAIIPTATGQIGINPVDVPDPESLYVMIVEHLTQNNTSSHSSKFRTNRRRHPISYRDSCRWQNKHKSESTKILISRSYLLTRLSGLELVPTSVLQHSPRQAQMDCPKKQPYLKALTWLSMMKERLRLR